jgi:hypothetical protein
MAFVENGALRARPRRFFSQRLHRWSLLVQHPTLITWREFVCLILSLYALYEAYFAIAALNYLFFTRNVQEICPNFGPLVQPEYWEESQKYRTEDWIWQEEEDMSIWMPEPVRQPRPRMPSSSGMFCLRLYLRKAAGLLLWRIGNVVIWVPIAVLAIFLVEEFVLPRRSKR